jgi:hypothetical protein
MWGCAKRLEPGAVRRGERRHRNLVVDRNRLAIEPDGVGLLAFGFGDVAPQSQRKGFTLEEIHVARRLQGAVEMFARLVDVVVGEGNRRKAVQRSGQAFLVACSFVDCGRAHVSVLSFLNTLAI